jgi:hypothetical protein
MSTLWVDRGEQNEAVPYAPFYQVGCIAKFFVSRVRKLGEIVLLYQVSYDLLSGKVVDSTKSRSANRAALKLKQIVLSDRDDRVRSPHAARRLSNSKIA